MMDEALRQTLKYEDRQAGQELQNHHACLDKLKGGLRDVLLKVLRPNPPTPSSGQGEHLRNQIDEGVEDSLAFIEKTLRGQNCGFAVQIFNLKQTCLVLLNLLKLFPDPTFEAASMSLVRTSAQLAEHLGRLDFELLRNLLIDCNDALAGACKWPQRLQAFPVFERGIRVAISGKAATSKPTNGLGFELSDPARYLALFTRLLGFSTFVITSSVYFTGLDSDALALVILNLAVEVSSVTRDQKSRDTMICACLEGICCLFWGSSSELEYICWQQHTKWPSMQIQWRLLGALPSVANFVLQESTPRTVTLLVDLAEHAVANFDESLVFPKLPEILRPFSKLDANLRVVVAAASRFSSIGTSAAALWLPWARENFGRPNGESLIDPQAHAALGETLRSLGNSAPLCTYALGIANGPSSGNADLTKQLEFLSLAVRSMPRGDANSVPPDTVCQEVRERFLKGTRALLKQVEGTHLGTLEIVLSTILGDPKISLDPESDAELFFPQVLQSISQDTKPPLALWRVFVLALQSFAMPPIFSLTSRCRRLLDCVATGIKRPPHVEATCWVAVGHMLLQHLECVPNLGDGARTIVRPEDQQLESLYTTIFTEWSIAVNAHGGFGTKHPSVVAALSYVFPLLVTFACTVPGLLTSGEQSQVPRMSQVFASNSLHLNSEVLSRLCTPYTSEPNPLKITPVSTALGGTVQTSKPVEGKRHRSIAIPLPAPCPFCNTCSSGGSVQSTPARHGISGFLGAACQCCGLERLQLEWRVFASNREVVPEENNLVKSCPSFRLPHAWGALRQHYEEPKCDGGRKTACWLQCSSRLLDAHSKLVQMVKSSSRAPQNAFALLEPADEDTQMRDTGGTGAGLDNFEITWLLSCGFFGICVLSSRDQLRENSLIIKQVFQQLLSNNSCDEKGNWERDSAAAMLLGLVQSNSFVSALLQDDEIMPTPASMETCHQELSRKSSFELQRRCHKWRLEVLGAVLEPSVKHLVDNELRDEGLVRADLVPNALRAVCAGAPQHAMASQLSVLVGAAVGNLGPGSGAAASVTEFSPRSASRCLQRLLMFGMLGPVNIEDLLGELDGCIYRRLFETYSKDNHRVGGICSLLLRGPLRERVLDLLPEILPAMVLGKRMCAIQDVCALVEESPQSLFTPQLPFILSTIAQQPVRDVVFAFQFMIEKVYRNQMTIANICDASLGKMLFLILWKYSSSDMTGRARPDDSDGFSVAKAQALAAIDHIMIALNPNAAQSLEISRGTIPRDAKPQSGATQSAESTPSRKRKLSDWASPGRHAKRQVGKTEAIITVPLVEDAPGPSAEVVQTLEQHFLHILDIFEILSGRCHSPKYAEYSPLLRGSHSSYTMDFGRLFSAAALLFELVPSSLHRFAPKILEFLQSATVLSEFQPGSVRCWRSYITSVGLQRLKPLIPAVVGELLALASSLRKSSPQSYKELCVAMLDSLIKDICKHHASMVALLPSLPAWPELAGARAAVEKIQGPQRADGFAARLESAIQRIEVATQQSVKRATLSHMIDLFASLRSEGPRGISELPKALVIRLMRSLLTSLWESSASPADQLKCGELLGALGAIDPSYFSNMDIVSNGRSTRTPDDLGNMEVLARRVLTEFLIPSITSHNDYAFAAQEISKYLRMSGKLDLVFAKLDQEVRETLRPYLQSSYKLIDPGDSQGHCSALEGAVALATSLVQGEQRAFFEGCLPALHGNHALALFLMHHIMHSVLNSTSQLNKLEQLSQSLANLLESHEHSTAQAVFALIDDMAQRREDLKWSVPVQAKPIDINTKNQRLQRIDRVMKYITPRRVVAASVRCGAHARALFYLERAIVEESKDAANAFDNPRLESEEDCLLLQSIYRDLEERDGVLGALRVGPSTSRTRTLELEQAGCWHNVLSCYEEQLASLPSGSFIEGAAVTDAVPANPTAGLERRRDLVYGIVRCNQNMRRFEASLQLIQGSKKDDIMHARLRPLAVEASWQLSRWDGLKHALAAQPAVRLGAEGTLAIEDEFQLGLGNALLAIHERNADHFATVLRETTLQVTCEVASAARESYQRAYRHLLKLHVLADLGWVYDRAKSTKSSDRYSSVQTGLAQNLLQRLAAAVPTFAARQLLLSPLQVAMTDLGLTEDAKFLELEFIRLCRKHRAQVPIAMEHPTTSFRQVSPHLLANAQLEWGKLLYVRGSRHEALQHMQQLASADPNARLLGARWATESASELLIPKVAETEFLYVKQQLPEDEKAWFYHASYLDQLLKEQLSNRAPTAAGDGTSRVLKRAGSSSVSPFDLKNLVLFTLRGYLQALHRGNKRLHFILSRVLQIAWDCCELDLHKSEALHEISVQSATMQPWMWYVVLTQLISRVHNPDMKKVFTNIIMTVVIAYPTQSAWHFMQLLKSSNKHHQANGHEMALEMSRKNAPVHVLLQKYYRICDILIALANHAPADGVTTMSLRHGGGPFLQLLGEKANSKQAWSLLVPLQSQMTAVIPRMRSQDETKRRISPFPDPVCSSRCSEEVDVFRTKEKPKKLTFIGDDGRHYPFLCKAEKRGDLRKDSRMMEFGVMVNQLLQKNPDTRRRNLEVRTFNVVIFAENTGLIEWVPNTKGMRNIIDDMWKHLHPGSQQPLREIKELVDKSKNLYETFTKQILPRQPPVLHHWFARGADPSAWLSRRITFCRSQALWCMLGYVLGLGDRHGENILLDTESGRMVHVDFDCLFGKGMLLERPENVPFRLTQNCVAAMGITGVEGIFRTCCELCMGVLRDRANQQTLLSVLHVFIADPLIEWGGRSRQARDDERIQQARNTIGDVEKKLNGMLNVGAVVSKSSPALENQSVFTLEERGRSLLGRDRGVGLSVAGQVDELLKAAMCKWNLSEMYVGWQPWQ